MRPRQIAVAAFTLAACAAAAALAQISSGPVETQAPWSPDFKAALPGQTRAPLATKNVQFDVEEFVTGIENPWGLAFLPTGELLISEKPGRLRVADKAGKLSPPVAGLPNNIYGLRQGGLLGLALDPNYASNRLVYFSYAEVRDGPVIPARGTQAAIPSNGTTVARGRLVLGAQPRLEDVKVIFRQMPTMASPNHFGGRLVFARDGKLFVTLGERSILEGRVQSQQLRSGLGKLVRINADGSIPRDNPYVGCPEARPEIWASGLRNVQGATLHPATGQLWTVEHGPRGGDELNRPQKGKDYGWPTITYGAEYAGPKIGAAITQKAGLEQPVYYWDPVIAPGGIVFYTGNAFPAWKGSLFVGGMASMQLTRLTMDGDRVVGDERLLFGRGERYRDVVQGPDGALYLAVDAPQGKVIRIVPKR